jgi:hypothetical protein
MSLLRIVERMILGINVHVDYAVGRARVIRSRPPSFAEQFDLAQLFQCNAAPV